MKKIKLTLGKVALVDDEDFEWLNQWKWYASYDGNCYYAMRSIRAAKNKQRSLRMHRLILGIEDKRFRADHIDGNGLNNQRHNLRIATQQQNCHNKGMSRNNTSGYKGVSFESRHNLWVAHITHNGKTYYIKSSKNKEDAALAYNKKAIELFGEFAKLNNIK